MAYTRNRSEKKQGLRSMSRRRMIKPEFWGNEQLAECSFAARLLFIGLMNFEDDNGLLEYRSKKIKMNVFPGDNVDIDKFITELVDNGLIEVYESSGHEYIWTINFTKHQRVDKPSYEYPTPNEGILARHGFCLVGDKITKATSDVEPNSKNFAQVKLREDKVSKDKIKFLDTVLLTQAEHEKLLEKFKTEKLRDAGIELLNNYLMSKGKKYRSHYHVLIGWVLDEIKKKFPSEINQFFKEPKESESIKTQRRLAESLGMTLEEYLEQRNKKLGIT